MVWQVARCFWEPPWAALALASPPGRHLRGPARLGEHAEHFPLLPDSSSLSTPYCVPLCYPVLAYLGLARFFCFMAFEVSVNDSVST